VEASIPPSTLIIWSVVLSLLPILIGTLTCLIKVSLVLGMLRNAFGVQGVPGKTVEFALSLGVTIFVMNPVMQATLDLPETKELLSNTSKINFELIEKASKPWQTFLSNHTGQKEISYIVKLKQQQKLRIQKKKNEVQPKEEKKAIPFKLDVLIPGFILSELNNGFLMGFSVLLPFLVLDLIVANLLIGIGLSMLSPTLLAFPLKVLLFVAVDGWALVIRGLILSYN
jgi:type III secretory pathway component EscR